MTQTLTSKILRLKLDAYLAGRTASFWQQQINEHGEQKAEAFYRHLGLNHLAKKSFEYEGLTLSREPKEHEKLAVKGIAQAQESGKEAIGSILLDLRTVLISDGLESIRKLSPANYHKLVLSIPSESRSDLRDRLIDVHRQGRELVIGELNAQAKSILQKICPFDFKQDPSDDEFDELDDLTDLTGSRVVNDVQSRLIAAMQRFTLAGLDGANLINAVTNDINGGSVAYIDRAATGLANKVVSLGRSDEAEQRSEEWERVEYSALLDQNVCEPCASFDGQSATNEDDLEPAPSPSCQGGDFCRCFHAYVAI